MKKIISFIWIISLIVVVYGLLPCEIPHQWNPKIGNQIYGNYLQSTGGDFLIIEESIDSELIKKNEKIFEINIIGEQPSTRYDFSKNYEYLLSKFILTGKIVGKEKELGLGEFYIFEVEKYQLAEYLPKIWNSEGFLFTSFPICIITFLISSISLIFIKIKNRKTSI